MALSVAGVHSFITKSKRKPLCRLCENKALWANSSHEVYQSERIVLRGFKGRKLDAQDMNDTAIALGRDPTQYCH